MIEIVVSVSSSVTAQYLVAFHVIVTATSTVDTIIGIVPNVPGFTPVSQRVSFQFSVESCSPYPVNPVRLARRQRNTN
jgi:hypothetical protein